MRNLALNYALRDARQSSTESVDLRMSRIVYILEGVTPRERPAITNTVSRRYQIFFPPPAFPLRERERMPNE